MSLLQPPPASRDRSSQRLSIQPGAVACTKALDCASPLSPRLSVGEIDAGAIGAAGGAGGKWALPHLAVLLRDLNSNPAGAAKAADTMLECVYPPGTPLPPNLVTPEEGPIAARDVELEKRLQAWCSKLRMAPTDIRVERADGVVSTAVDKAVGAFQGIMMRARAPVPPGGAPPQTAPPERSIEVMRYEVSSSIVQRPSQLYIDTLKQTLDLAPITSAHRTPRAVHGEPSNAPALSRKGAPAASKQALPPIGLAATAPFLSLADRLRLQEEAAAPPPEFKKPRKRHGAATSRNARLQSIAIKHNMLKQVAQSARHAAADTFSEAARFAAANSGAPAAAPADEGARSNFWLAGGLGLAHQQPAKTPRRPDPYRIGRGLVRERRLHDASRVYLEGLQRSPADSRLQRNFDLTMNELRTTTPAPWARWPWEIHRFEVATEETERAPPGPMDAPRQVRHGPLMVEVGWQQYSKRHQMDWITGYELEIAEISPLEGVLPFKSIYMGERRKIVLNDLNVPGDIIVRVRAFKRRVLAPKFLTGEWSGEVQMAASGAGSGTLTEIDDIPPLWRSIDIEDILKYERNTVDPQQNWEALLRTFYNHRLNLKIAFRYYALEGTASNTDVDPNTMDMRQFAHFCKVTGLLGRNFGLSDADRLYMRSVRKPNGLGEKIEPDNPLLFRVGNAVEKNSKTGELPNAQHWWERTSKAVKAAGALASRKGGNVMHQDQFVASLVRLCVVKYPNVKLLCDKMQALCDQTLLPHVNEYLKLLKDEFSDRMQTKLMRHVLGRQRESLHTIYKIYSQSDQSEEAKKALQTMNIKELGELCTDADIYDLHFGVRELIAAFVKVNIDDDIYYQNDMNNSSSELVFDEFEEVIARIFYGKEWVLIPQEDRDEMEREQEGALERTFHEWLEFSFIPVVLDRARAKWPHFFKLSGEAIKDMRAPEKAELSVAALIDPNDRPPTPAVVFTH